MFSSITFITSNPSKSEQIRLHLDQPIEHQEADIAEIQSLDLMEVTTQKAKDAFKYLRKPVLVDDTAVVFNALAPLPGPLVKWFLQARGNEGLCRLLDPYPDRSATAAVIFALYDGETMRTFEAEMKGTIAKQPEGGTGFGWDPIFIPAGKQKPWGALSFEEQKETSMRRLALEKLGAFLKHGK